MWISSPIRYVQYQKFDKKTFLSLATLTRNNKRFLFRGHFFRWKSDTSTSDNLQIIGKVQNFLEKSTCIRKLESLKLQQKVQSHQLFTWKVRTESRDTWLQYESTESVESREDFVILADKRLDYFLTELELISNLETPDENWIRPAFHLTDNNRLHVIQELIDPDKFLLHCLSGIYYSLFDVSKQFF